MMQNRRNWSDYEDKAIISLVKKHGTKNWAEISEKMASKYGIQTRTGKQCRERWHNHLNPEVNKNAWTEKEEQAMFEAHQRHGNRWTEIAKHFPGRTDNDIKNHFYSMLRRSLRRVNKLLGLRNSTQRIRLIKPSVLSNIFSNSNVEHADDWKAISEALFEFSRAKSVDQMANGLEEGEKHRLQELIERIAVYNEEYQQSQLERKESRRSEKEGAVQADRAQKEEVIQEEPPLIKKASIKQSAAEKIGKTKRIKHEPKLKGKILKPRAKKDPSPAKAPTKIKRGQKKKQEAPAAVKQSDSTNLPPPPPIALDPPTTRLKRRESEVSFKLGEQISIPDLWQLPQLGELSRKRSSLNADSRRVSSSNSSSFFNANSPRMDLRIFTRTPQGPTPNIADIFSRNFMSLDWKANNQELDNIVTQTRKAIERKTNRSD